MSDRIVLTLPPDRALHNVARLVVGGTAQNLIRVFGLREKLKSLGDGRWDGKRVHVIGAGTMGGDIAAWCVVSGMQAGLQDVDEAQIAKALSRAKGLFKRHLRTPTAINAGVARLIADPKGKHIKHADIVIEAIVEKLDVKQKLFQELEKQIRPGAVLATNTSSSSATISAATSPGVGGSRRRRRSRSAATCT